MAVKRQQEFPPYGRLVAAGMAVAGAFGLLLNHFLPNPPTVGRLLLLLFGPLALFLGLGGIVEPKIVWAVGKYGKDLPAVYKVIGAALAAIGVAVTIVLVLFVYLPGPSR
jgi:hypothetical protein